MIIAERLHHVCSYISIIVGILAGVPLASAAHAESIITPVKTPIPDQVATGTSDSTGPIYTTLEGMTLYTTALDKQAKNGVFGCSDTRFETAVRGPDTYPIPRAKYRKTCVERWSPFLAPPDPSAVGRWSILTRPDGQTQWAYDDQPLYTSTRDRVTGDINGTFGFGAYGTWRTVQIDVWFPPNIELVQKVDGLLLATEDDSRLIFTPAAGANGNSTDLMPIFAAELALPDGDFKIIVNVDGSKQWAFKGTPLYYPHKHIQDYKIQENVASGMWQPVLYKKARNRPEFLTMHMSVPEIGWVYADSEDRSLYVFYCLEPVPDSLNCDQPGNPASYRSAVCGTGEQCAREWRPLLAEPGDKPVGYWGIADVPDPPFKDATGAYGENVPSVRAWTYHGRPVYTFPADRTPGEVLGHGIDVFFSIGFGALTVLGDEFPASP